MDGCNFNQALVRAALALLDDRLPPQWPIRIVRDVYGKLRFAIDAWRPLPEGEQAETGQRQPGGTSGFEELSATAGALHNPWKLATFAASGPIRPSVSDLKFMLRNACKRGKYIGRGLETVRCVSFRCIVVAPCCCFFFGVLRVASLLCARMHVAGVGFRVSLFVDVDHAKLTRRSRGARQ